MKKPVRGNPGRLLLVLLISRSVPQRSLAGTGIRPMPICPRRAQAHDALIHRACGIVSAGKVAGAHQKLSNDLPAAEDERLAEKANPLLPPARVVLLQPV